METRRFGIGLDIGTAFINKAVMSSLGEIHIKSVRDAFFDIDNDKTSRDMLDKSNVSYIVSSDSKLLYVVGQEALNFANIFRKEIRRPLQHGVISTREAEALLLIKSIITNIVETPSVPDEICKFSIPAEPIDADYNTIYHQNVLKSFIESAGYKAEPVNEGKSICYSELSEEDFTGLCFSFGAGMVNCALLFKGIGAVEFSIARSGDWIDENAAKAIGERVSKITSVKEFGIDISKPLGRTQEAISIFYKSFISYVVKCFDNKINASKNVPEFPEPISVIIAGGTSLAGSFNKVFKEEMDKYKWPFSIKEIRSAKDPFLAVAKGCLYSALSEY